MGLLPEGSTSSIKSISKKGFDGILLSLSVLILISNISLKAQSSHGTVIDQKGVEVKINLDTSSDFITEKDLEEFENLDNSDSTTIEKGGLSKVNYNTLFSSSYKEVSIVDDTIQEINTKEGYIKVGEIELSIVPFSKKYNINKEFKVGQKVTASYVVIDNIKYLTTLDRTLPVKVHKFERDQFISIFPNSNNDFQISSVDSIINNKSKREYKIIYKLNTLFQLIGGESYSNNSQLLNRFLFGDIGYTIYKIEGKVDENNREVYASKVVYGNIKSVESKAIIKHLQKIKEYQNEGKKDIRKVEEAIRKKDKVTILEIFKKYEVKYNPKSSIQDNIYELETTINKGEKDEYERVQRILNKY